MSISHASDVADDVNSKLPLNSILLGDCVKQLATIPSNSIDVIFADPPYNLKLKNVLTRPDNSIVHGVEDEWDKFDSFSHYDDFTTSWLKQCQRVLKPSGTMWVMGSYHNIFRVGALLQSLGFWILNDVVWLKSNPMPNFRGTRFTNAHETLIWTTKNKEAKNYTFNYNALKNLNEGLQMRSDWFIPLCRGKERVLDENGKKIHPTQKPEALLQRVILSSSNVGDVILDPFFGTGTTGVVAKKLGRKFIGIEQETIYIQASLKRLAKVNSLNEESLTIAKPNRKQSRVPFGLLIEMGYLLPGTILYCPKGVHKAKINLDGRITYNDLEGSIHQMGAAIEGSKSCNGWFYWHFKSQGKTYPLDQLRSKVLAA